MSDVSPSRRSVMVGLGSLAMAAGARCASSPSPQLGLLWEGSPETPRVLSTLEDRASVLTVLDDGSAALHDKRGGVTWQFGRLALQSEGPLDLGHAWPRSQRTFHETYPGRFRGARHGDRFAFSLFDPMGRARGTFSVRWQLDDGDAVVEIADVSDGLDALVYPPPVASESLLFPRNQGLWLKRPLAEVQFWRVYGKLTMGWFGGLRGDAGWLCAFEQGDESAGVMVHQLAASAGWLPDLGRWPAQRSLRFRLTQGGYVGLAKAYRTIAQRKGHWRALDEKIAATPAVAKLKGGRLLTFLEAKTMDPAHREQRLQQIGAPVAPPQLTVAMKHKRVGELLDEALASGLPNAVALVQGWIPGGYDWSHPDVWPPEPALGSIAELEAICRRRDRLAVGVHDNYQDIYARSPQFPKGTVRDRQGDPMLGGFWVGGQAFILDAREGLALARRNWNALRQLGMSFLYVDTVSAVPLYESWAKGAPLTRAADRENKRALLAFFKAQGLGLASEEGHEFALPWLDLVWCRHERAPGSTPPLWPLVFHDAVFSSRILPSFNQAPAQTRSAAASFSWLTDMLWGYPLGSMPAIDGAGARWSDGEFTTTAHVDAWNASTATAAMVNHRYLSDDGQVEQTEFSSGRAIAVNFSERAVDVEGKVIAPRSFLIRD